MAADRTPASHMEEKRAEMLADVVSLVERLLTECGLPPAEAQSTGDAVADMLADFWGGQNFTIPKDWQRKLSVRDLAVYDAWRRGYTFDVLAREHKMSERGLRKLITRVRQRLAKQRQRQQPDLLDQPAKP